MNRKPEIVPSMKVGAFLEAYPQLEGALIEQSPQFKKLKNPVLRKTVARIVTLQQAAATGGIPVDQLVNVLRTAAGLPALDLQDVSNGYGGEQPAWLADQMTVQTLNVTETINQGGVPLPTVMEAVRQLAPGTTLELVTPIMPVPIIDKLRIRGCATWTRKSDDTFHTYIFKKVNAP